MKQQESYYNEEDKGRAFALSLEREKRESYCKKMLPQQVVGWLLGCNSWQFDRHEKGANNFRKKFTRNQFSFFCIFRRNI